MNPLEQLPYIKILAIDDGTHEYREVLIDGDYDGEFLGSLPWRVTNGYVSLRNRHWRSNGYKDYLHHYVLPEKAGYKRVWKNGNRLDCRSRNIIYKTSHDLALEREVRKAEKLRLKYLNHMKELHERDDHTRRED